MKITNRCSRCNNDKTYQDYHDNEWWKPVHDDRTLFEFLILEWVQAWLSWITVLKKRENYRKAFDNFDVEKVAKYGDVKYEELLNNEWIIRNKLKIKSAIKNAKIFIEIQKEFWSFDKYIWGFVDGKAIKNKLKNISHLPAMTPLSDKISKDLKKRWMNFVGSTIIYAYMQAIGIVNDHTIDCDLYKELK